ncbi:MAG: AAA family ATPase, partial [Actinomycetota bacterium]
AARHGEPGLVLISGEPGIGKTRLAAHLAASAHDDGSIVLYGRSEQELDVPFRPWAESVDQLVAGAPAGLLDDVADWGADLGRLVPSVGSPPPSGGDPDSERLRLFTSVSELLRRAGAEAPVMLVLDDLHWADESSLLLLRHVVRHRRDARLLVVGTYRDTDLARTHPLAAVLADLRREAAIERIDLGGLDQDEVNEFLNRAADGAADPDDVEALAATVWSETEGNPFFIGEVINHLVDSGALVQRQGQWQGDEGLIDQIGLPEGIREVVGRRLAELSGDADEILRAAAVIGPAFDASVVASVLDTDVDAVVTTLDDAVRRRLLVEDDERLDRFRFVHALVRTTLLEEIRTSRRVRLHHRIGLALEQTGAGAPDLAHHFGEAAVLADADKAVEYSVRAAEEATERFAFEQSVRFRRMAVEAVELLPSPDDALRAEMLTALGEARNQAGDALGGRTDYLAAASAARASGRADLLAQAAYGYGGDGAHRLDLADADGPALLDEALEALPQEPSIERARCLAKRSEWRAYDTDATERMRQAEAAVAVADDVGDPSTLWWALRAHGDALADALEPVELRRAADRLIVEFVPGIDD